MASLALYYPHCARCYPVPVMSSPLLCCAVLWIIYWTTAFPVRSLESLLTLSLNTHTVLLADGSDGKSKTRPRAEIARDVDIFLPHLRLLFSIWTPRQREKKKISFQQFMESQTGREGEGEGGGKEEGSGQGAGAGAGALPAGKGDAEEKRGESALTMAMTGTKAGAGAEAGTKRSASDFHGLLGYIQYLSLIPSTSPSPSPASSQGYSLFLELSMLLVGRVGRVSAVRLAAADTVRLCGSLHQVTAIKAVGIGIGIGVTVARTEHLAYCT